MKKRILSLLLLLFVNNIIINGQDNKPVPVRPIYSNAIGIGAGFTTGYGLSYRYMLPKMGFQVNLGPTFTDYGKNADVSVGLTLLNKIAENKTNNFYLYFANHYLYRKNNNTGYNYNGGFVYEEEERWNTGVGVGFEFNTKKRIVLNVMTGYAQYNSFKVLFFTVETALYYRF